MSAASSQRSTDPQQLDLLRVCRIGRAQGLKGEVTVQVFTDDPERRFEPGAQLFSKDGEHEYTVASSRTFKNRWILRLDGVNNRDASEALNGTELYTPADSREELEEEDAWYPKDLIGLTAVLAKDNAVGAPAGRTVGTVVDVIDGAAQTLLKIRLAQPMLEQADGSFLPEPAQPAEDAAPAQSKDAASANGRRVATALVPFVDEIVPDIDLDARTLTLDPPGGLIPGL